MKIRQQVWLNDFWWDITKRFRERQHKKELRRLIKKADSALKRYRCLKEEYRQVHGDVPDRIGSDKVSKARMRWCRAETSLAIYDERLSWQVGSVYEEQAEGLLRERLLHVVQAA